MKIAYLLSWDLGKYDGVTKKVLAQAQEWISNGHQVTIFCISTTSFANAQKVPVVLVQREKKKNIFKELVSVKQAYKQIYKALDAYKPDIIYHRSEIYQSELSNIMAKYPTVVEMNSNDLAELKQIAKASLKGKIRYQYYKRVRDTYLSKAAGFCCVTYEIAALESIKKYQKPSEVIPNTIVPERYNMVANTNSSPIPRLLFMGSPDQEWHGIDKILALADATVGSLEFEVVGPAKPNFAIPINIGFHGYLQQHEYEKILARCDVGICTMALHRKNMHEASPLKTREYLAYGLPVIIGYNDTAFNNNLPDWVLQLDNTENNIINSIQEIERFSNQFKGVRLPLSEVVAYIDIKTFEHKRISFMEKIHATNVRG